MFVQHFHSQFYWPYGVHILLTLCWLGLVAYRRLINITIIVGCYWIFRSMELQVQGKCQRYRAFGWYASQTQVSYSNDWASRRLTRCLLCGYCSLSSTTDIHFICIIFSYGEYWVINLSINHSWHDIPFSGLTIHKKTPRYTRNCVYGTCKNPNCIWIE